MDPLLAFLSPSALDRMPRGTLGEWQTEFYANNHEDYHELVATGSLPLLWFVLFSAGDLRHAHYTDMFDRSTEADRDALKEMRETYGTGTYPYYVTTKEQALRNLQARTPKLVEALGESSAQIIESFRGFIETNCRQEHILMRTGEFGPMEDPQGALENMVALCQALEHPAPFSKEEQEFWSEQRRNFDRSKAQTFHLAGDGLGESAPSLRTSLARNPSAPVKEKVRYLDRADWLIALGFFVVCFALGPRFFTSWAGGVMIGVVAGLGYLLRRWTSAWRVRRR